MLGIQNLFWRYNIEVYGIWKFMQISIKVSLFVWIFKLRCQVFKIYFEGNIEVYGI